MMDNSDLYDALVQSYTKDIENYKEILQTYKSMLNQKEKELQAFRNKAISLLKTSAGSRVEDTVPTEKKTRKKKQEMVLSGKETEVVHQKKQRKPKKGKLNLSIMIYKGK